MPAAFNTVSYLHMHNAHPTLQFDFCKAPEGFPHLRFKRRQMPTHKGPPNYQQYTAFNFLVKANNVYLTVEEVNLHKTLAKEFNDWYAVHGGDAENLRQYRKHLHMANSVVDRQFEALEEKILQDEFVSYQYVKDRLEGKESVSVDMLYHFNRVKRIKEQMKLDIVLSNPYIIGIPVSDLKSAPTKTALISEDRKKKKEDVLLLAVPAFLLFLFTIGNIVRLNMPPSKLSLAPWDVWIDCWAANLTWLACSFFLFGKYLRTLKKEVSHAS